MCESMIEGQCYMFHTAKDAVLIDWNKKQYNESCSYENNVHQNAKR